MFSQKATRLSTTLTRTSIPHRSIARPLPSTTRRASSTNDSSSGTSSFRRVTSEFTPFIRPFAKVFLGAIFAYQVIYWTWLKLEMDESKVEKNKEVAALEKQAREIAAVKNEK